MRPRNNSRDFAIVLFCLIGIAVLNDYSHNRYQGVTNPVDVLEKVIPSLRGYHEMTLYTLLDEYAKDAKKVEGMGKVGIVGQILKETPLDATESGSAKQEKVGDHFRLFRRFSESGGEEGSQVISINVHYTKPHVELEPNMWVLVVGQVTQASGGSPGSGQPTIEATKVSLSEAPDNPILSPKDTPESINGGGDEHDHEY